MIKFQDVDLVGEDVAEEDLVTIVELEVGRNLVEGHVAKIDAWKLQKIIISSGTNAQAYHKNL